MVKVHTFVVTLRRNSRDLNWGLRLVGGADLSTPLVVTRTNPGTPASKELIRGDIIAKIEDYDARDLRHEDAQNLFKNAGNTIKLVVQREAERDLSSRPSSASQMYQPSISSFSQSRSSPYLQPPSPYSHASSSFRSPSPAPTVPTWKDPLEALPHPTGTHKPYSPWPSHEHDRRSIIMSPYSTQDQDESFDESIMVQPYRTTPLVLPGAKVRHEPGPTESYLRHHPNPAMRANHHERDSFMKQRVADSVIHRVVGDDSKLAHKQYNSPINLYSEPNIANTIRQNATPVPHKTTVHFDPSKSETYRALQEESYGGSDVREINIPVQTKVYSPTHNRSTNVERFERKQPFANSHPGKDYAMTTTKEHSFVKSIMEESIQQSNSFKRLMHHVLGESDF